MHARDILIHAPTYYPLEAGARRPEGSRGGGGAARRAPCSPTGAAAAVVILDGLSRPGDQVLHLRLGEADVVPRVGQTLHAVLTERRKEVVMSAADERDNEMRK